MTDPIRVLHVDDEPAFAELTATALERSRQQIEVETAQDPAEGLARLSEAAVDCVVSDYDMPGLDGLGFLEAVREKHPDLPFVLFTGKGSERVASEAIAAGATEYLQKGAGSERFDLLANRIRNAVEQYRATRRAAALERVRTLASEVNQALVRAPSATEAERRVCEIFYASEPYLFAWIGEVDPDPDPDPDTDTDTDRLVPRTAAGRAEGYLEEITITADEASTGRGPGGRALREGRVAVSQNVAEDPAFEPWREAALEYDFRAVAVVPLAYRDTSYGVLSVYASRPDAFDDEERALLAELGDDIGHALHTFDIQARLRAECDRREALFENAPSPVLDREAAPGTDHNPIVAANDAFEDVFGYDVCDITGEDITEVLVPEDDHGRHVAIREDALAGEPTVAPVSRETADGVGDFLLHTIPYGTENGAADGWYAWYTDISDRRARERAVEDLHATVRSLITAETEAEAARIAVEAVREVLGMPANAVHRYDAATDSLQPEAWTPETTDLVDEVPVFEAGEGLAWAVFDSGEPQLHADLSTVPERFNPDTRVRSEILLPVGDSGLLTIGSAETDAFDETDRKLAETLATHLRTVLDRIERERELERQNERLEQFASVVTHDLRSPLAVATGRLELARETADGEHVERAADAVDRSLALVDDLLALATEGRAVGDRETVGLAPVCEASWRTVETADASLHHDVQCSIRADPGRLQQLFENLFANAVDHGGTDVSVTVTELADGFAVADDGPGIAAADVADVFGVGYSTAEDGTGFGLNIVREIAEAHGWTVSATESADGGACFEITGVEFADG